MNAILPGDWPRVRAARLPISSLAVLAPLRDRTDIQIHSDASGCWVTWSEHQPRILALLLSAHGVEFAFEQKGKWFRVGSRLPLASGPPKQAGRKLIQVLLPQRFSMELAETEFAIEKLPLEIVRGGSMQETTALRCVRSEVLRWSEEATTLQLRSLLAAYSGEVILLLGSNLPPIGGTRFWGNAILIPIGYRVEPELPVATLKTIFEMHGDELLLLDETGAEKISRELFQPLTRAGLRLGFESTGR